jgi:hypothetical protein
MSVAEQRRLRPAGPQGPQGRAPRAGRGRPGPGPPGRFGDRRPPSSRAASASGSPWPGPWSTGPRVLLLDEPLGRPGPPAAPGDAGRAEGHPGRGRDHLRGRDPRPGGGPDHERPHRRAPRRPHRAGRRPRPRSTSGRPTRSWPGSSAPPTCSPAGRRPSWWARPGTFTVRPEKIHVLDAGAETPAGHCQAAGTVRDVAYAGPVTRLTVAWRSAASWSCSSRTCPPPRPRWPRSPAPGQAGLAPRAQLPSVPGPGAGSAGG